ncbi:MAG: hypothetical protein ACI4G0_03570 [Ruminococcus sp.]
MTSNPYKGNVAGSQPEFSFRLNGTSDRIYLFEAPIDMLSFISMHWKIGKIIVMRHPVPFRTGCFL